MRTFNNISFYLFILHVRIFLNNISCNVIINDNISNSNVSNIDNLKAENDDNNLNVNKWKNEELVSGNSEEVKDENKYYPSDVCEKVGIFSQCPQKEFNSRNNWNHRNIKNTSGVNTGVYVPPRRNKLCLLDLGKRKNGIKNMDKFKEELLKVASGESYALMEYFKNEPSNAIAALDYSFADLGDIVKGTDKMNNKYTRNINTSLNNIFSKQNDHNDTIKDRSEWWNNNKNDIWEAMVCGYSGKKKDEKFPEHNNIDEVPQFFRWFREWGKDTCYEYEYNLYVVIKLCKIKKDTQEDNSSLEEMQKNDECTKGLEYYLEWFNKRKTEWDYQSQMFNNYKGTYGNAKKLSPQSYLMEECIECNCKNKDLENTFKEMKNKIHILEMLIKQSKEIQDDIMRTLESSTQIISNDFTSEEGHEQINNRIEETSEDIYNVLKIPQSGYNTSSDDINESVIENGDEHLGDVEEEEMYEDSEHIYETMEQEPTDLHSKPSVKKGNRALKGGRSDNGADNWKLKSFGFPWSAIGIGFRRMFSVPDPNSISQAAASAVASLARSSEGTETGKSSDTVNEVSQDSRGSRDLQNSQEEDEDDEEEEDQGEEEEEREEEEEEEEEAMEGGVGGEGDGLGEREKEVKEEEESRSNILRDTGISESGTSEGKTYKQPANDDIPYDRILGWEFGDFSPKNKYPEDEKKENMLEVINLTSWDSDDIANENEDEKEENVEDVEMYSSYVDEIEEKEDNIKEDVLREDISDDDLTKKEEGTDEEEEMEEEETEEEETEEVETVKDQNYSKEEKNNVEKNNSKIDNEMDQLLSSHYKDNDKKKEDHKSVLNSILSLFNNNDDSHTFLKGLRGDMTFFFQNI